MPLTRSALKTRLSKRAGRRSPSGKKRFTETLRGRFAVGLAIGIFIELLMAVPQVENTRIVQALNNNNFAMDTMIHIYAYRRALTNTESALTYTFVDVDERTFRNWKEPFFTPRDKVLEMICWAITGRARLVIVDLDLSHSLEDMDEAEGGGRVPPADDRLRAFLRTSVKCPATGIESKAAEANAVPIVVLKTFLSTSKSNPAVCQSQRSSFLERPDLTFRSNVFWATSEVNVDSDGVVRTWRLWEQSCREGSPTVTPSVQLRGVALAYDSNTGLDQWLDCVLRPKDCFSCGRTGNRCDATPFKIHYSKDGEIPIDAHEDSHSDVSQRIVYAISDEVSPINEKTKVAVFQRIPAREVVSDCKDAPPCLASGAAAGRVIVVGVSHEESADLHRTPLGTMPGAMIVINSMHSLTQYKQLRPTKGLTFLIGLVGVFIVAALFASFHHLIATLVASVLLIVASGTMSFHLFKSGQWMNFALPILAIWIHHFVEEAREAAELRRRE